jgi:hypothetical protein
MTTSSELEARLAAVEAAVADLQRRLAIKPGSSDWLHQVAGCVTDEEAFEEILELGRAIRAMEPGVQ